MRDRLNAVHGALGLLDDDPTDRELAHGRSTPLADRDDVHGLLAGRVSRLLLDAGRRRSAEEGRGASGTGAHRRRRRRRAAPPGSRASWPAAGTLLVHDAELLGVVDGWLAALPDDVHRGVAAAAAHLRRVRAARAPAIGERVRRRARRGRAAVGDDVDLAEPTQRSHRAAHARAACSAREVGVRCRRCGG